MKIITIVLLLLALVWGCHSPNPTEIYVKKWDNVLDVSDSIVDIKTSSLYNAGQLSIIDSLLVMLEAYVPEGPGIHFYHKNNFKYLGGGGIVGNGDGEIGRLGQYSIDYWNRYLWIDDHGKNKHWYFSIDSMLNNPEYRPTHSLEMNTDFFLVNYYLINDTTAIGLACNVLGVNSFEMRMANMNMRTSQVSEWGYEHPEVKNGKSKGSFDVSLQEGISIRCGSKYDFLTVCDLDGRLKFNIYGPSWNTKDERGRNYFKIAKTFYNLIVVGYSGDFSFRLDEYKRPQGIGSTQFQVFDVNGNYKITLYTKYEFALFCIDEENNRLIVYFENRDNPLGYIDIGFLKDL